MASITITVGQLTSTIEIPDARAVEILTDYRAAHGLPQDGTPQQQLDSTTHHVAGHVTESANGYRQRAAVEAERERVREAVKARAWGSAERAVDEK